VRGLHADESLGAIVRNALYLRGRPAPAGTRSGA